MSFNYCQLNMKLWEEARKILCLPSNTWGEAEFEKMDMIMTAVRIVVQNGKTVKKLKKPPGEKLNGVLEEDFLD